MSIYIHLKSWGVWTNDVRFNSMIPKIAFVINLDARPDRWKRTRALLQTLLFIGDETCKLERFSAMNGYDLLRDVDQKGCGDDEIFDVLRQASLTHDMTCGALGCLLSHYFLLSHIAQRSDLSSGDWILIFEDDVHFVDETEQRLCQVFNEVSEDMQMVFLGGRFHPHFEPSPNAFPCFEKVGGCLYRRPRWNVGFHHHADYDRTTHAYMIQKSTAEVLRSWIRGWIQSTRSVQSLDTHIYGTITTIPTHDTFPHAFYSPLHYDSDIQEIPIARVL